MRKSRKNYTPVEKVGILRRHLIDRVSISDLCDEYQLSPTLFYAWQKIFFENGFTGVLDGGDVAGDGQRGQDSDDGHDDWNCRGCGLERFGSERPARDDDINIASHELGGKPG